MSRRVVLAVCVAAAGVGCSKLTAPDGIKIEGGVRKFTTLTPCELAMPEGFATERGSMPALGSCSGDSRIKQDDR